MTIRQAIDEDLPAVLMLADRLHAESRYGPIMEFDSDKVAVLLQTMIDGKSGALIVAERDDRIIGFASCWIMEASFSRALIFGEYGIYVVPEHRGGMTGPRLVKAWRDWGRKAGAIEGLAGITTGIHSDQTARMYELCGGHPIGPNFAF